MTARRLRVDGDGSGTRLAAVVRHLAQRASVLTHEQRQRACEFLREGWSSPKLVVDQADDEVGAP